MRGNRGKNAIFDSMCELCVITQTQQAPDLKAQWKTLQNFFENKNNPFN